MNLGALPALLALLLLVSCATLLGPRQVTIPVERLQAALENRFPFNNRYLELLDIRVSNPRVALQPDTNRILTSMDASVAPPFLERAWSGSLAISGQLRYDPVRNALVLAAPRVENFQLQGLDPAYADQVRRVGSLLAEQMLDGVTLYTFRPDQLRHAGTAFVPSEITARRGGLVVTFEPAR